MRKVLKKKKKKKEFEYDLAGCHWSTLLVSVPRSQCFCSHQHVFRLFEESPALPLWLKAARCFLGCRLSRPRIKWPPLLNTGSGCLLKVFPARRRTNSGNKRQRDEVGWGGHVQLVQPSFYSDFPTLGFFPLPFHPLLIILLPHFMFPHASLSFHSVRSSSL